MNLKSKATALAVVLTIAIGLSMILAGATPGAKGPYIHKFSWQVIKSSSAQLTALTTHVIDCGGVPDPAHIPKLKAAKFTITSAGNPGAGELGYDMLFMNNIVYPCDDVAMRKAIIRLIDKAALDQLYYPISEHIAYWLPESQAPYVNRDAKLPLYDPTEADAILATAGYVYSIVPTPVGWYDPDVPGSQPYYRIDPDTGLPMEEFEYVTRPLEESPLSYEQALINSERFHAMGIPAVLTPKSWELIVPILTNSDPTDYQMLTGVGIVWGSPAPDILYNFLQSEQSPLWNVWNFQNEDADYWCEMMKGTLDPEEMKTAAFELQDICNEYLPYVPVMQNVAYTAFTGLYDTNPGCIKIVAVNPSIPIPALPSSYDEFGKEYGESRRIEAGKHIYKSYLGAEIDSLNPLMANTEPAWQVLDLIMGDFIRLNPYSGDYIFLATEDIPEFTEWTGPLGESGLTLEYTLRDNLKWHDGTPVTAADCVFALNLMRFQQNARYLSIWEPIYDVVQTGTYSFKIWYLEWNALAHEYFGISLFCPSNIWAPWVDSPETGEPLAIVPGAGPMGGDVWTSVGRHHSKFKPWEIAHPTDPDLTCLIGTDNFLYPPGGWTPGVSVYVEAWKDPDNYIPRINPGDCTLDGIVDMVDVWQVLHRQGDFRGMCYPASIGGHPRWNPIADIAGDAQIIDGSDLFVVYTNFGERWWPPE